MFSVSFIKFNQPKVIEKNDCSRLILCRYKTLPEEPGTLILCSQTYPPSYDFPFFFYQLRDYSKELATSVQKYTDLPFWTSSKHKEIYGKKLNIAYPIDKYYSTLLFFRSSLRIRLVQYRS